MTKRKTSYAIKRTAAGLGFFTLDAIRQDKKIIEYIGLILTKVFQAKEHDTEANDLVRKIRDYLEANLI